MTDSTLADRLKATLRGLPGPVALITTVDAAGAPHGMLASAVIPVSMEPPSMLVAINRSASMHPIIAAAGRFCMNVLGSSQADVLALFSKAELRAQRFESDQWRYDEHGLPWLPSACSAIFCRTAETTHFGTHELFIGEVLEVVNGSADLPDPMGWINGSPARLGPIG